MTEPDKYTSLIIDGMAQQSCKIPRKVHEEYCGSLSDMLIVDVMT